MQIKLLFVAGNPGDIPLNTALMIISTKTSGCEVNLAADFSTNNSVQFIVRITGTLQQGMLYL
jgi:hypothetical protein